VLNGISWEGNLLVRGDHDHTATTQMHLQALGQVTCGRSIKGSERLIQEP
jgi:hypothetical protein